MVFTETAIPSAFVIDIERRSDERGFFARAWCREKFETAGLDADFVQANIGFSSSKGTLRGMHYQEAPYEEAKLVRCVRGAVFDVVLDLRPDSPAFGQWIGYQLSAQSRRMIYVPKGCAHGYLATTDDAEVFYHVSQAYHPAAERGVRYDDPLFGIEWPIPVSVVSEKDRSWPDFTGRMRETR